MTRAAKAKGRGGQQEVRDRLLETFPEFEPDDIKSTTMGDLRNWKDKDGN